MTAVRTQLTEVRHLAVQTLDQTYDLIFDLRPTALDDLGLVPAIRWSSSRAAFHWRSPPRTNALYVQWLDAQGQLLDDPQPAVPLHWNAANRRITRREVTAPSAAAFARVIVGARLQNDETLWVDDVALVPGPEVEMAVHAPLRS